MFISPFKLFDVMCYDLVKYWDIVHVHVCFVLSDVIILIFVYIHQTVPDLSKMYMYVATRFIMLAFFTLVVLYVYAGIIFFWIVSNILQSINITHCPIYI